MIDECWLGRTNDDDPQWWLQPFRSGYHYETRAPREGWILTAIPAELYARFCRAEDEWIRIQVELEDLYKQKTQKGGQE